MRLAVASATAATVDRAFPIVSLWRILSWVAATIEGPVGSLSVLMVDAL